MKSTMNDVTCQICGAKLRNGLTKIEKSQTIRNDIFSNEGNLKTVQRKRTAYGEKNSEMLFDGIRDQKLKANWIKTPQPVVIKLMTARCLRDKIPKGDFIIRAGVLDRLVENRLYYKFVEYGNRVKDQQTVE